MKKKFLKTFFRYPWAIIVATLLLTGFFGFFLKNLALENSLRSFFPQKDTSYDLLTKTEDEFGSMLSIGITLETKSGTTILTPEYIDVVRKITDRTLELPEVEDIDSVTHIDYVCDENGSISATQLIPDTYTGTDEDIFQLKSRLAEWHDMYNRVIVNDDSTGFQMQISLRPKSDETLSLEENQAKLAELTEQAKTADNKTEINAEIAKTKSNIKEIKAQVRKLGTDIMRQQKVLAKVKQIVNEETDGHHLNVKFVGEPVLSEESKQFMISDLLVLIPLVIVVVLLSLYMSFKTVTGMLLPLCTVLLSTIISVGMMGFFGITFTLISSVIPVSLIAVGSAYGIHVLSHYYIAINSVEGEMTREKYEDCVFSGLNEVIVAVFLAGITTIVGFISLITSPLGPLHSFAVFTAVGVSLSLLLSITFIPAVLLLKDYRKAVKRERNIDKLTAKVKAKMEKAKRRLELAKIQRGGKTEAEASGDTLYSIYKFFCGSVPRLVLTSIIIIVLSFTGLKVLKIDTALINYFPKNCDFRKDVDHIDQQYAGSNCLFFVIQGQEKGDISNPELLKAVDNMEHYLAANHENIGKIVSFTTFIKRINQVWHVPGAQPVSSSESSGSSSSGFSDGWDDWGSDFGTDNSVSSDDWSNWGTDDSETQTSPAKDFVDPNIAYSEQLETSMTTKEILELFHKAYVEAGGQYASVEDIVNQLMKQVNYNGTAYYEIPYDTSKYPVATREELKNVVENYLTLLSGSLDRFIDDDMNPKEMRITCQLRSHSSEESGIIIADAKNYAAEHFPEGYTLEATGSAQMEHRMTSMIVSSQITSLALSLFSVFLIIAISFRSCWAGLLGAIPLAFSILLNYMTMGFCEINLDFITSIIASVAVGVGIDYTIHFMTTYREERAKTDNVVEVLKETFRKSGRGILTNALAVGLGFLVLTLSKFIVLRYIGILVAIVMFTSSFLAMTIIPGILNLTDPKFMRPKEKNENK